MTLLYLFSHSVHGSIESLKRKWLDFFGGVCLFVCFLAINFYIGFSDTAVTSVFFYTKLNFLLKVQKEQAKPRTGPKTKEGPLLTVILPLAWPRADASLGCDGHQRLPDGFLPTLPYIPSHARCCQSWVVVEATVVLPDVVHHAARDDLKAVWVATLRQSAKVLRRLHLQDLRQGDLLWNKKESLNPGSCGWSNLKRSL